MLFMSIKIVDEIVDKNYKIKLSTEKLVFYQQYSQLNTQKVKKKMTNNQHFLVIHKKS